MTFPESLDNKIFRLFVQRTVHLMNSNAVLSRTERQLAGIIEEHPEAGLYFSDGVVDVSEHFPDEQFNPFLMLSSLWEVEKQVDSDSPRGIRKLAEDAVAKLSCDADLKTRLSHLYLNCFNRWKAGEEISDEEYLVEAKNILFDPLYYDRLIDSGEDEELGESEVSALYRSAIDMAFLRYEKKMYDEASTRSISPKNRMSTCMNKLPAEWISAMALFWQRPAQKLKRDRINDLASYLLAPENLDYILANLDNAEKKLLHYLVDNDGFAKYGQLSKRFGMEDASYWWTEHPPQTVIGRLRYKGLLYVGVAPIKSRNYKIGMIPKDLYYLLEGKI